MENSSGRMMINGFTVLQTKFTEKSKSGHFLYIKEYAARDKDPKRPQERTLFVVNIPPYCTKDSLKEMFMPYGKVLQVHLQDKPTKDLFLNQSEFFPETAWKKCFKVGYIVFKSPGSIEKVKSLPFDKPLIISTPACPVKTGVRGWCHEYDQNRVDINKLQTEINTYMDRYDQLVEEEKQKAHEQEGIPDEEGWITVTRHSKKNKPTPRTEAMESKLTDKEKHKRRNMEFKNFYTFQARETKRNDIATLRKKFEEDKQRIALMKAARKFKPY